MEPADLIRAIEHEGDAIAAAVERARSADVPACPGWTVADLAVHVGVVHRWAAETVRTRATERVRGALDRWGVPADRPDLADWVREGVAELSRLLRAADPDAPVFTWGPPPTVRFWLVRQAVETALHRWDAESASGTPAPIDAALAAEGLVEWFGVFVPSVRARSSREGAGETFHFHRTDGEGEWLVSFPAGTGGVEVQAAHAKGDAAVRGPAPALLLFLWHRPAEGIEVFGDAGLIDRWFELLPPP
jgi:uncharacterized protein (TIGR03083 family)